MIDSKPPQFTALDSADESSDEAAAHRVAERLQIPKLERMGGRTQPPKPPTSINTSITFTPDELHILHRLFGRIERITGVPVANRSFAIKVWLHAATASDQQLSQAVEHVTQADRRRR